MRKTSIAIALSCIFFASWSQANSRQCRKLGFNNNIQWAGLKHDSFDPDFRSLFGAQPTDSGSIKITFQTCADDVTRVRIRLWDDVAKKDSWQELEKNGPKIVDGLGAVDIYSTKIKIPHSPTILYYFFEIEDGEAKDYYTDDDPLFAGGGIGKPSDNWNDQNSFQLTVYDKHFSVPKWMQGAVVYQIFPDRFRDGDLSNSPVTGEDWIYGVTARKLDWTDPLCDPRGQECPNEFSNQFYGGDLEGVRQKLPYLANLGVDLVYLNPIFQAPSNHLYDVQDYKKVDPYFGTNTDFQKLTSEAKKLGIRFIVDGSLNHTSSDHPFFDFFSRWDTQGACESDTSRYRDWYFIPDSGTPARLDDQKSLAYCNRFDELSPKNQTFEAWFGYYTLPKLNTRHPKVRNYLFGGGQESVAPFWLQLGSAGWRLDVASDIDSGPAVDVSNDFWEEFRKSVRKTKSDAVIIGEEWGDASSLLLGQEMDSVMNYRFRSAALAWLFDSCQGGGCQGNAFVDNDSNVNSSSGPINKISMDDFVGRLRSIEEDYPKPALLASLNLVGSHDTNRIGFLLKKISNENIGLARKKQLFLAAFQTIFPGAMTIYYGDEVGLSAEGVFADGVWQDDPYNRQPYPWNDLGLNYDEEMLKYYQKLGNLRKKFTSLRVGKIEYFHVDSQENILGIKRSEGTETVYAIFNRSAEVKVNQSFSLKDEGTSESMEDLLTGKVYDVKQGKVFIPYLADLGVLFFSK